MSLAEKLEDIELKIRQLGQKMDRIEREKAGLATENQQLKTIIDRHQGAVDKINDKLERTQQELMRQREAFSKSKREIRQQIDRHLEEIDKCIEWLQAQ
jgi:predicted  nucleic acid-binding Zn-ribbon protein